MKQLFLILGLASTSAWADTPEWIPGALAVRCQNSAWHLYEAWNFSNLSVGLPADFPKTRVGIEDWFLRQISGVTMRILEEEKNEIQDPGSYNLNDDLEVPLPNLCEKKLITKIFTNDQTQKVFYDRTIYQSLPAHEQILVSLRNTYNRLGKGQYSSYFNEPYSEENRNFFRALVLNQRPKNWLGLQQKLFPNHYPEINGMPYITTNYFHQDYITSAYFFGLLFKKLTSFELKCDSNDVAPSQEWMLEHCQIYVLGLTISTPQKTRVADLANVQTEKNQSVRAGVYRHGLTLSADDYNDPRPLIIEVTLPEFNQKKWAVRSISMDRDQVHSISGVLTPDSPALVFHPPKNQSVTIGCGKGQWFWFARNQEGGLELKFSGDNSSPSGVCVDFDGNFLVDVVDAEFDYSSESNTMKMRVWGTSEDDSLMRYAPHDFWSGSCAKWGGGDFLIKGIEITAKNLWCDSSSLKIHNPFINAYTGSFEYGIYDFHKPEINRYLTLDSAPISLSIPINPIFQTKELLLKAGWVFQNGSIRGDDYDQPKSIAVQFLGQKVNMSFYQWNADQDHIEIQFELMGTVEIPDATGKKYTFRDGVNSYYRSRMTIHSEPEKNQLELSLRTNGVFNGKCASGNVVSFGSGSEIWFTYVDKIGLVVKSNRCAL